jgi:hypothetical protein
MAFEPCKRRVTKTVSEPRLERVPNLVSEPEKAESAEHDERAGLHESTDLHERVI